MLFKDLNYTYSRASVARTLMARSLRLFRTRSKVPNKKTHIAKDIIVFWDMFG